MTDSLFDREILEKAGRVIEAGKADGAMVATAESCTGGGIAAALTEIAGSSAVVDRGFVTYTNEAKSDMLGVPAELIARLGAVSAEVAVAMAEGALVRSGAKLAVAVTGVAGPGGGTAEKPVGLVHFGLAVRDGKTLHLERRFGDLGRGGVRRATILQALDLLRDGLN